MGIQQNSSSVLSEFLQYLSKRAANGEDRLPPLTVLSKELKISVASLREQLEIARVLGFVDIKPKTGIRWLPYQFAPSVLALPAALCHGVDGGEPLCHLAHCPLWRDLVVDGGSLFDLGASHHCHQWT